MWKELSSRESHVNIEQRVQCLGSGAPELEHGTSPIKDNPRLMTIYAIYDNLTSFSSDRLTEMAVGQKPDPQTSVG